MDISVNLLISSTCLYALVLTVLTKIYFWRSVFPLNQKELTLLFVFPLQAVSSDICCDRSRSSSHRSKIAVVITQLSVMRVTRQRHAAVRGRSDQSKSPCHAAVVVRQVCSCGSAETMQVDISVVCSGETSLRAYVKKMDHATGNGVVWWAAPCGWLISHELGMPDCGCRTRPLSDGQEAGLTTCSDLGLMQMQDVPVWVCPC